MQTIAKGPRREGDLCKGPEEAPALPQTFCKGRAGGGWEWAWRCANRSGAIQMYRVCDVSEWNKVKEDWGLKRWGRLVGGWVCSGTGCVCVRGTGRGSWG